MHLISLRHNLFPYMHLFWTKSSKPTIGILALQRLQKWVSILQISRGTTFIFSQLLNTLLSSISLQNVIVRYFFHIFFQGFIKQ
jgi:hypothetical protein